VSICNTFLDPFIEGSHDKYNGKYYL
jgi:hypothetical protein